MFWTNYERYCQRIGQPANTVAANCGVKSSGTVTGWKNGAVPRPKILARIVAYFNAHGLKCDVASLMAETDEDETFSAMPRWLQILQTKYSSLDEHGKSVVDYVLNSEYERCQLEDDEPQAPVMIRHYLYSPAAGVNGLVSGEDYEDIQLPPNAPNGADYCLTVSGDSMEPYISDGDLIYVKEDEPLQPFDVGVFCVDGSTYVKQYCPSIDGSVYLLSANPKREDANITITRDSTSSLLCFGKVLLKKRLPQPIYN